MQEIKLKSVTTMFIDDEKQECETINDVFDLINIPDTEAYREARYQIITHLIAFHEVDLSPAYPGHTVRVTVQFE